MQLTIGVTAAELDKLTLAVGSLLSALPRENQDQALIIARIRRADPNEDKASRYARIEATATEQWQTTKAIADAAAVTTAEAADALAHSKNIERTPLGRKGQPVQWRRRPDVRSLLRNLQGPEPSVAEG